MKATRTTAIPIVLAIAAAFVMAQVGRAAPQSTSNPESISPAQIGTQTCARFAQSSVNQTEAQIADRQFALGMERMNANDPGCAIPLFDAVLDKFPFATPALANRALAKAQMGDWEGAETDADRAISLDGSTSTAFNVRGIVAAHRGDHSDAIAAFTRSIELFPRDRYARIQRMRSYALTGQADAALADVDWLIATDPRPHNLEISTNILIEIGRTGEALDRLDQMISRVEGGTAAELLAIKARLLIVMHRNAEAVVAYDKAIKLQPTLGNYLERAEARASIDRAEALKDLEAARQLDSQSSDVVRIHAWLLTEAGDGGAAIKLIDQALDQRPQDLMLLGARAYIHEKLGQIDAALDDLDVARRSHPGELSAAIAACLTKARFSRRLEGAQIDCDAAISADPYSVQALDARGLMLLQVGRAMEALRDYTLASRVDPTDEDARFGRGVALLRLGEKADGASEIAAATKLSGEVAGRYAGYGIVLPR